MLPEFIQLIVVTPERQLLRESVVEVAVPGLEGQLGILPGHAPLMTELGIGELSYRTTTSSQPVVLAVINGFAEVLADRVRSVFRVDAAAELRSCDVPILYLRGDWDFVVPEHNLKEIAAIVPGLRVEHFSSPHMVLQIQPAAAAKVIGEFVASVCSIPLHG